MKGTEKSHILTARAGSPVPFNKPEGLQDLSGRRDLLEVYPA
ncbi:MAG: hypothetical protein Q8868_09485 [Bacteroidota bacterium]|nr:hypothetical protein [Bacteroidota bacterium]